MDDLINRQDAIATFYKYPNVQWTTLDIMNELEMVPSSQPTLYGYKIEHLVFIAKIMEKENLPPEKVAEILSDTKKIVEILWNNLVATLANTNE